MSKRVWTDDEIRSIREERAMGAKRREICRKWQVSEGHLDRILAGTTRREAGGPLTTGETLETRVHGLTKEQIDEAARVSGDRVEEMIRKQAEKAMLPSMGSERALGYGARVGIVPPTQSRPVYQDIPISESGVPLPPDWREFQAEEHVVKQSDADRMIEELIRSD
jgi:hypothetical protein